jgi:hypothetical protein
MMDFFNRQFDKLALLLLIVLYLAVSVWVVIHPSQSALLNSLIDDRKTILGALIALATSSVLRPSSTSAPAPTPPSPNV